MCVVYLLRKETWVGPGEIDKTEDMTFTVMEGKRVGRGEALQ